MKDRKWIISNYDYNPLPVIQKIGEDYCVYQQGNDDKLPQEIPKHKILHTKHSGHNLSDYLKFIIDNYQHLPDELGFIKGNIFPRHIVESVFVERIINSNGFIPLYSDPKTFAPTYHRFWFRKLVAQQVAPGFYLEITNNWYVKTRDKGKYYPKLEDLYFFITKRQVPNYIVFVPGACMIVPRDNILRWPLEVYEELYQAVTYSFFPVEAYHLERCMLYLFYFCTY